MSNIIITQTAVTCDFIIYPMSDNSVAFQIYPSSPATHYDKVDEEKGSPNDDTDYVFCNMIPPAILDM